MKLEKEVRQNHVSFGSSSNINFELARTRGVLAGLRPRGHGGGGTFSISMGIVESIEGTDFHPPSHRNVVAIARASKVITRLYAQPHYPMPFSFAIFFSQCKTTTSTVFGGTRHVQCGVVSAQAILAKACLQQTGSPRAART
jgi:hypothetical protein